MVVVVCNFLLCGLFVVAVFDCCDKKKVQLGFQMSAQEEGKFQSICGHALKLVVLFCDLPVWSSEIGLSISKTKKAIQIQI